MAASKPFTFVCGADDFLVNRLGRTLFDEKTSAIGDDFGKEIIDGAVDNVAEVEAAVGRFREAVQTLPLFGDRKVVWMKDVTFLADSKTGRAEGTLEQVSLLRDILGGIDPEKVEVLISASPVDRRRRDFKWLQEHGEFHYAGEKNDKNAVYTLIAEEARTLGVNFTDGAVELLVAKINGNTRLALEEVRKLATYLGDEAGPIEESLVAGLVPDFGDSDFFETAEAFFSLDLPWTLDAIHRHFFAGHDARPLITTLQGRNRLHIQLRVLLDSGELSSTGRGLDKRSLEQAAQTYARHFGEVEDKTNFNLFSQNPWYLGRLAEAARRLPLRKLIDWQSEFLRAFEEISKRPKEQEQVMRELAARCFILRGMEE